MSPLVMNEIKCFEKMKEINVGCVKDIQTYFFPIVSYKIINREKYSKPLVLITKLNISYYNFLSYFYNYRYYADIIETYKDILYSLSNLHSHGIIYNGFVNLKESSIHIDKKTKKAFLHNFQYTYEFTSSSEEWSKLLFLFEDVNNIPSHIYIYLYIMKNNISFFGEMDRSVMCDVIKDFDSELLVGLSAEDIFVNLKKKAFYLDICEITKIYLKLCYSIKNTNRHFGKFIDILESILLIENGEVSANEVIDKLDHIIE